MSLQFVTRIENLYPDIEFELENRHSSLYSKIKLDFTQCYEQMVPEFFISVKGVAQIFKIDSTPFSLGMALQNGVILSLTRIDQNQNIYINQRSQTEELILNNQGQMVENPSHSIFVEYAQIGFKIGNSYCKKTNLHGSIIYMVNNIPKDAFHFKQAHILAFAIAALVTNNLIDKIPIIQIEEKISHFIGRKIPLYHLYENDNLHFTDGIQMKQIHFQQNNCKLFLCDIQLTQSEENLVRLKQKKIEIQQNLLQTLLINGQGGLQIDLMKFIRTHSFESFQKVQNLAYKFITKKNYNWQQCCSILKKSILAQLKQHKFDPRKFLYFYSRRLENIISGYNAIQKLIKDPNAKSLTDAIKISQQIQFQSNLLPERAKNLITFCLKNQALASTIIENRFLLVLIEKPKLLRLFQRVRQQIFFEEYDEVNIQKFLFSTLPSKGVGLLKPDPSTQLWY